MEVTDLHGDFLKAREESEREGGRHAWRESLDPIRRN